MAPAHPPPPKKPAVVKAGGAAGSGDAEAGAAAGAAAAAVAGVAPPVQPPQAVGGAGGAAGVPVPRSMAEIMAGLIAEGGGGKPTGQTGGKGRTSTDAELKLHRQAILQLDARLRRRDAAVATFLAPDAFAPAHAGAEALASYLRVAKREPNHTMGPLDVVLFVAILEELTTLNVVNQDVSVQQRMAALYLLYGFISTLDPHINSEWIHSCQVAAIPAVATRPARCLISVDVEGEMLLPTAEMMPEVIQEIVRAETVAVDFLPLQNRLFCIHEGVPCVPWNADRRGIKIARITSSIFCCLGATQQHGVAGRGKVFKALAKGKGKGKDGKGQDGMDEDED